LALPIGAVQWHLRAEPQLFHQPADGAFVQFNAFVIDQQRSDDGKCPEREVQIKLPGAPAGERLVKPLNGCRIKFGRASAADVVTQAGHALGIHPG
jgi:hypothetical protein